MKIGMQVKTYHEVKQNNAVSSEKTKSFWAKKIRKKVPCRSHSVVIHNSFCRVIPSPWNSTDLCSKHTPQIERNILVWRKNPHSVQLSEFEEKVNRTTINAFFPPLCEMKLVSLRRKAVISYREVFVSENSIKLSRFQIVWSFNKQKGQILWNQSSLTDLQEVRIM